MKLRKLAVAAVALGALGIASGARANTLQFSGTICKAYNPADVSQVVQYYGQGTYSLKTSATQIICPLIRPAFETYSYNYSAVSVDVLHSNASDNTSCTVLAWSFSGQYLGSASFNFTGSGWSRQPLTPLYLSPSSNITMICWIPANGEGTLVDINVKEY